MMHFLYRYIRDLSVSQKGMDAGEIIRRRPRAAARIRGMPSEVIQRRLGLAVLLGGAAVVLIGLVWFALHGSSSRFLPPDDAAEWVLYPASPRAFTFTLRYEQHAIFKRTFELAEVPAHAGLRVRAFRNCVVQVNGQSIDLPVAEHWNVVREADTASQLRAGSNDLRVVVTNDVGPAVLWLRLEGPGWTLASDSQWSVSLDGAAERPAHPASQLLSMQRGSGAEGGPQPLDSLERCLPVLLLFAALSAGVLLAVHFDAGLFGRFGSPLAAGLCAAILLWLLLFFNNTFRAPLFPSGFDADAHLNYVRYILNRGSLPLADEGWEMHQPPLYYLLCARLLRMCGLSTEDEGAALVLRLIGLALGLVQLVLAAACLRLLFPAQPRRQLAGMCLAAFLPAQIYTCQYVTNEVLLTTLGAAALYLCLRTLRHEQPLVSWHALLGLCLGAALLTKVTALVVVGAVLLVLIGRLMVRGERRPGVWLRGVGVTVLAAAAVSGWHYKRVWAHFGTPLAGNYNTASGFWWWQPPGYGTLAYYTRFGHALTEPFYSALYGIPDGVYSSLWGDGLCGGAGAWPHRPPWNYDLMAAGFLLALPASAAIGVGLVAALWQLVRRPRAEWFLLLGVLAGLAVGVSFQLLRYPYFGHARASYLLTSMLPVCALGAIGLDMLARLGRAAGSLLAVLMGVWACTAYASFWIDPSAAATQNWAGNQYLHAENYGKAFLRFRDALQADPHSAPARLNMVRALLGGGETAQAHRAVESILRNEPNNPDALLLLAYVYDAEGRVDAEVGPLRRASELAPDHPLVFAPLGGALMRVHRDEEAVAAYREALRVSPWDPVSHANLGLVLARTGLTEEAIAQYRLAIQLIPDQPEWLADLAWILATQEQPCFRDPQEALRLADESCRRTVYRDAVGLQSLAAAQAAAGRYAEALQTARRARAITPARTTDTATMLDKQVRLYEQERPFFSNAPGRSVPYR
jgi:tetratricopeptide (TPR) repeat protein